MSGQAGPIRMGVIGYGRAVVQMHAPEIRALGDKFRLWPCAFAVKNARRKRAQLTIARPTTTFVISSKTRASNW